MTGRILVVDDIEANIRLLQAKLQAEYYDVLTAHDGASALEIAARERPDLILMDIQLPAISGLEVTRWLKEDQDLESIPVVAITAFAMRGDEERIRDGGCAAYIAKPISVAHFLETVRTYLEPTADTVA
jgi:two-component system cell cycle response regulator DivK